MTGQKRQQLIPGTHEAIAAGLDAYHAINLFEALKLVPDTGDWHGSLRIACGMALERTGPIRPNSTAEEMELRRPSPSLAPTLATLNIIREAARSLISAYMAGDDLATAINELADAAGLRQQEGS